MKVTPTSEGISLELTVDEAIKLEAVIGRLSGRAAKALPWYDDIADVLEEHHLGDTRISLAIKAAGYGSSHIIDVFEEVQ